MKLLLAKNVKSSSPTWGKSMVSRVRSAKSLESVKLYEDFTTNVLSISIIVNTFLKVNISTFDLICKSWIILFKVIV